MRNAILRFAIHQTNVFCLKYFRREGIVIKVKSAGQSPTTVQNKRAHDRACGIALLFENLSNGTKAFVEWLPSKILHTILKRIRTSQDRRM